MTNEQKKLYLENGLALPLVQMKIKLDLENRLRALVQTITFTQLTRKSKRFSHKKVYQRESQGDVNTKAKTRTKTTSNGIIAGNGRILSVQKYCVVILV